MKIEKNKVVSLIYTLRNDSFEGNVVESVDEQNPMQFIFGSGMMLEKFESNLNGLEANNEFQFKIESKEAYGDFSAEDLGL